MAPVRARAFHAGVSHGYLVMIVLRIIVRRMTYLFPRRGPEIFLCGAACWRAAVDAGGDLA
jgi:hypothetical protein